MSRYTLYINFKEITAEIPLPAVNNREVMLDMSNMLPECRLSFEVYDDVWSIKSNDNVKIEGDLSDGEVHTLCDGDAIKARLHTNEKFVIMVYELKPEITTFHKYDISERDEITIGKSDSQDISISDRFISSEHAVITRKNGKAVFVDKSLNGSYINGTRISGSRELHMYDVIYTVGFKMVFLEDSIALNRSDIVKCRLKKHTDVIEEAISDRQEDDVPFSRSPRVIEPLFDEVVEIESPPAPQKYRGQPLIFIIGPSVTMPLPILMSTIINSQGGTFRAGALVSVGVSAIIGAGWALAHQLYNKKTLKEDEEFRVEAYKDYIKKNEAMLAEKHSYNNSILMTQYLSSNDIVTRFFSDDRFIWNRNINHDDFLTVRVGTGLIKFKGEIAVSKQRFSLHKDKMAELPHKIKDKFEYMPSVSVLELGKHKIVGVIGEEKSVNEAAANIAVQLAATHCYTDVKIAALFKQNEYNEYGWMRWLPHTYTEDMKLRMIACESNSYQNVLYHINGVLRSRAESIANNDSGKRMLPHYVVFCTSETIFDGDGMMKYMSMQEQLGVTFVLLYKSMDRLPNECKMILECSSEYSGMYSIEAKRGNTDRIKSDRITANEAERFARKMSGMYVRSYFTGEIPDTIEYFGMLGIGNIQQWNLIKKYKENRVYEGIRSFVGIAAGGKPMYIDIHEKKYGPHGLVAGTTGSGKSEALQTFIISLALNYHPDEVAFILIDYKGGGMANAFTDMPHIAGTITNLGDEGNAASEIDETLTRRALVSIKSEIKRRQAMFNKSKVNHIDMYIRMYRDGKVSEPLPHLIIISDEFAELKKEQPEFIKELVSTARVGRSLGIHLILATQKPAGVVDDEIWSNSRFKLCLRVQDKQDSMGMLKRPEAAYLTQTGRAYLQIGNDEIFEQFQTGYSGADYYPKAEAEMVSGDICMINIDGTAAIINNTQKSKRNDVPTQLETAVKHITSICESNGIRATRALWLPALPTYTYLEEVTRNYSENKKGISASFGIVDDPEKQLQCRASINLAECSNLVVAGMSGSGKTTLLQTLLMSLITDYSCEEVTYYIFDFGGRTLKLFGKVPHCGMVAFSDENEYIVRMMKFVDKSMNERKKLFDNANVGSYSEYVRKNKLPLMLMIIDNYFEFAELYQNMQDDFMRITRDCAKYGIQFIITCNSFADIRYKLRQNFGNAITLIMNEKGDYREAYGVTPEFMPQNRKGRGLIACDGRILEFQTALPVEGKSESERNDSIMEITENIMCKNRGLKSAERVAVLPKNQKYEEFCERELRKEFIPVGYAASDISVYGMDLFRTYCYSVSGNDEKGISLVMKNIMYAANKLDAAVHTVKMKTEIKLNRSYTGKVHSDKDEIRELLIELKAAFIERAADKRAFLAENPEGDYSEYICGKYGKIFVFIDSMDEFLNIVYDSTNTENMYTLVETFFKQGAGLGVYFIAGFGQEINGKNFYTPSCKNFIMHRSGIHLGGCLDKQKLFDVSMSISQMSKPAEYFIGYVPAQGGQSIFVPHTEETVK